MSAFLPEGTASGGVQGVQPALDPDEIQRNIKTMQTVCATAAQYPQQIPSDFLAMISDAMQVSNLLVPISQIVGFPQQSRFLDRSTSTVDVASTAVETTIYSKQINAGDMGSDRFLRLTIAGDFLHNNAGADTITLKIKFGGTTFWGNASAFGATVVNARHPWGMVVHVANLAATNSQMIYGWILTEREDAGAPSVAGIGAALTTTGSTIAIPLGITTLGTIDTTAAQTLEVTAKWSASSANNSWRKRYAMLELV